MKKRGSSLYRSKPRLPEVQLGPTLFRNSAKDLGASGMALNRRFM